MKDPLKPITDAIDVCTVQMKNMESIFGKLGVKYIFPEDQQDYRFSKKGKSHDTLPKFFQQEPYKFSLNPFNV